MQDAPTQTDSVAPADGECISVEDLIAMAEGTLEESRRDGVLEHLDRCGFCAEVVAKLGSFESGEARRVGRYEFERILGAGSMGIVYRAWDPRLRRHVAVKLVRPERSSEASRARMLREARALARIGHPNVVAVYDAGEHEGEIYVTTEFVDGETLATWTAGKSKREIVDAWVQVARGLAAVHAEGVVHRDVKPANVLVGRNGRVRIGDFGLALQDRSELELDPATIVIDSGHQLSVPGALAGTPAYMAPEQWDGCADARSDQYSMCVALVEGLTGKRPDGELADLEPPALRAALQRGLSLAPAARFPTIDALADALAAAIAPRKRRFVLALGATVVVATAAIGWGMFAGGGAPVCELPRDPITFDRGRLGVVAATVDRWSSAWTDVAADLCTTEPVLRARRERCLEGAAEEMREVLAGWRQVPEPMTAYIALDAVTWPARCSSAAVARTPEATPAQQIAGTALRLRAKVDGPSPALVDAARAVDFSPLTVDLIVELAEHTTDAPARQRLVRDAVAAARDDYSFGATTIKLIGELGPTAYAEGPRLAEIARPRITAIGDVGLEAHLDAALAMIAKERHDMDQAIILYERARRGYRAAFGADNFYEGAILMGFGSSVYRSHDVVSARGRALYEEGAAIWRKAGLTVPQLPGPVAERMTDAMKLIDEATRRGDRVQVSRAEYLAAAAFMLAGKREQALDHYTRATEQFDKLGIRDASLTGALYQRASILIELHRLDEAIVVGRRAVSEADKLGVDEELGTALTVLGEALVDKRDLAGAQVVLQRALAIRERLNTPPRFRANTRYLLAVALWRVDPERARALVSGARLDLEAAMMQIDDSSPDPDVTYIRRTIEQRLAQVDRLLAKR
ncbi:MAG: serine/threonine-protein kinase [Kofleriaceae bacterium]